MRLRGAWKGHYPGPDLGFCPPLGLLSTPVGGTGYCMIRKQMYAMGILSGFQSLFPSDAGHL